MIHHEDQDPLAQQDLIPYLFCQLKRSPIALFQEHIHKEHIAFQEGQHTNLIISKFIVNIEDKIRVFKHVDEWHPKDSSAVTPMALAAPTSMPTATNANLLQQIQATLQALLQKNTPTLTSSASCPLGQGHYREWHHTAPKDPNETVAHNNKIFQWCARCHNGRDQWVTSHTTETHIDGFTRDRSSKQQSKGVPRSTGKHQPPPPKPSPTPPYRGHVGFLDQPDDATALPSAQLSLLNRLDH
jgi:hypothetical protein